jgi:hypothetical protein
MSARHPRFNFLSQTLASLDGMMIGVGIAGDHPSGMPANELANLLRLGSKDKTKTGAIPARDFTTPVLDETRLIMLRSMRFAVLAKMQGRDPSPALRRGAEAAQEILMRSMHDYSEVPNARSTIERKGFNNPLIESGDLVDYVFGEYSRGERR